MRRRLLRTTIGIVLVTVLALGLPLAIVSANLVADGVRSAITVRAESIAATLLEESPDGTPDLNRVTSAVPAGWRLELVSADGTSSSVGVPAGPDQISVAVPSANGATLVLSSPDAELKRARWQAYGLVAAAVAVALLVGVGIALITARRLVNPLSELTDRAARLGAGDFRTSSRRFGIPELDRVADVLDASALEVAALLRDERETAADVSHQLRTRLTGVQLRLEELGSHPDPAVRHEVEDVLDQTDRLVAVVDGLLAAARARRAASVGLIELDAELVEVAASWRHAFAAAGRPMRVEGRTGVRVRATPARLREALGVLLDNSLGHGAGPVTVTVVDQPRPGMVLVEVADEGPGIVAALVPHIFDRGVSGASSSGLGLGLARAFVEADGGRLELRRARPAVFGVFLTGAAQRRPVSAGRDVPAPAEPGPSHSGSPPGRPDPAPERLADRPARDGDSAAR